MVKQKIPLQTEEIDGPHTHLLPQIILHQVHFPIPVNDNKFRWIHLAQLLMEMEII
jgi:hypothetical protein